MNSRVTDDDVRALAATARPYSLAVLRWADRQGKADAVEDRSLTPAADG